MGWHHHVALSLLTLWFLTVELLNQKKRTDVNAIAIECTGSREVTPFDVCVTNEEKRTILREAGGKLRSEL